MPVIDVSNDYEILGQHFPIISHYLCYPAQPLLLNYAVFNEIEVAVNGGRSYADVHCQYLTWLHALTIQSIELQLCWIFQSWVLHSYTQYWLAEPAPISAFISLCFYTWGLSV